VTAGATIAPLAADLGRVAAAGEMLPYDDVRFAMLDALLTAKQESRLGHEVWQAAFEHAARSLRMRVIEKAERELQAAAGISHYPARRLATLLPDAERADALLHRLLAEGIPLERFEGVADSEATRRGRSLALEVAWQGAANVAVVEAARWRTQAQMISAWQRPRRALWLLSGAILAVALLLAAWLGGQLPAPAWFTPVARFWWSLPWP
jgi:hypothetical protein